MIKRNYIFDHIGCNRVFNAPNYLKQHKDKNHVNKVNNFDYLSCYNQDVDVDFEIDESDTEEICYFNFIIPPIILTNPALESSIPDIGLNINNPDFFNDKSISIYSNYQEKILSNFK
jgi:hypothetical protein